MTEIGSRSEDTGTDFVVKVVIIFLAFPILVLVLHVLLSFPALGVDYLLIRLGGEPRRMARILSALTVLLACSGAFVGCKWIWPKSNEPGSK